MKHTNTISGVTIKLVANDAGERNVCVFDGKGHYSVYHFATVADGFAAYQRAFSIVANLNDATCVDVASVM